MAKIKMKITISIDQKYVAELDKIARAKHTNRSRLIEEAIRVWEKQQIQAKLKDGYLAMAEEDKNTAERNLKVFKEVLGE